MFVLWFVVFSNEIKLKRAALSWCRGLAEADVNGDAEPWNDFVNI